MAELRTAKRAAALAIALADIGGQWNLEQVTGALTDLQIPASGARCGFCSADGGAQDMPERDGAILEASTGLTVLAMENTARVSSIIPATST